MNRKDFLKSILVGAAIAPAVVEAAKVEPAANKGVATSGEWITVGIVTDIEYPLEINAVDGVYRAMDDGEFVKVRDN